MEINGRTDERTDTTDRITFLASEALSPYTSRNRKRIYEENTYDIEEQHRIVEVWIASGVFDDLRANDLTSDLDLDARRDDVGQLELPHASDAPAHHLPDSQRITSVMHTNTDALQTSNEVTFAAVNIQIIQNSGYSNDSLRFKSWRKPAESTAQNQNIKNSKIC